MNDSVIIKRSSVKDMMTIVFRTRYINQKVIQNYEWGFFSWINILDNIHLLCFMDLRTYYLINIEISWWKVWADKIYAPCSTCFNSQLTWIEPDEKRRRVCTRIHRSKVWRGKENLECYQSADSRQIPSTNRVRTDRVTNPFSSTLC